MDPASAHEGTPAAPTDEQPGPGGHRPCRLLIVDDGESNRLTLEMLLADAGYAVDCAASFAAAERVLERGVPYRLLLIDEHLGDGLGSQLVPLVRERLPAARIVLMSGSLVFPNTLSERGGADAVIDKNSDFPELLALCERLLE